MKRSYFLVMSALVFIVFSCKKEQKKDFTSLSSGYEVEVTMKNTPDSTWVFYGNRKNKDSIMVMDEKFEFQGEVEEPELQFIHTKDYKQGLIYVWLENQKTTITIENGNLYDAKITGGKTQKEFEILTAQKKNLEKEYMEVIKPLQTSNGTEKYLDSLKKRSSELLAQMDKINKNFIVQNPDSYVSSDQLNMMKPSLDKKEVAELYNNFTDKIKNSKAGKQIHIFITTPEKPEIGEKYVDFELPDTSGELVKLSDIKGKYILVEFWASWCYPCRKENPSIVKTYKLYREKGFEILSVSLDSKRDSWIRAIETDALPWKQVCDLKAYESFPALAYSIYAIPYNFLMDEQGLIIAENLKGNTLENKLKELFQ